MGSAIDRYRAVVEAAEAQRVGRQRPARGSDRWATAASRFRMDPRRELDENTAAAVALAGPDDVVIDVGGGAGRVGLPMALRCKELVNVEPSEAMGREFLESAEQAGIENVRLVGSTWPAASTAAVEGDVVYLANVTYFVAEIEPFVRALEAAANRLVAISVWSVVPPARHARVYEVVYGEPMRAPAGHRELLPALWEMGILPEVRVLPALGFADMRPVTPFGSADAAVEFALEAIGMAGDPFAERRVRENLDQLFAETPDGLVHTWYPKMREMIVSWTPGS